jgi:tRNA pseudouridine13 synthase
MIIVTDYILDILLGLYVYTYPILLNTRTNFVVEVPRPQGFIVSEIINRVSVNEIYERLAKNDEQTQEIGTYCVFIVKKTNIDTLTLAKKMCSKLFCKTFETMGLKETRAIAYQSIVLVGCKKIEKRLSINDGDVNADAILWFCSNKEPYLIHNANKFHITILSENPSAILYIETMLKLLDSYEWYILNFFGYQRFGSRRPITHILGKNLIKEDLQGFLNTLCSSSSTHRNMNSLENVLCKSSETNLEKVLINIANKPLYRRIIELFVNAYQSYLFNKLLSVTWLKLLNTFSITEALKRLKSDYRYLPLPGYATKASGAIAVLLDEILATEDIDMNSFCLKMLKNMCFYGDYRESLTKASEVVYNKYKNGIKMTFLLPPGSYATIVLRELLRCAPLLYT